MLATISDDTWNMLNMQHIIQNSKRWDHSDIPGGGHKKIKGHTHVVGGGHHHRKDPNPDPHVPNEYEYVDQYGSFTIPSKIMPY